MFEVYEMNEVDLVYSVYELDCVVSAVFVDDDMLRCSVWVWQRCTVSLSACGLVEWTAKDGKVSLTFTSPPATLLAGQLSRLFEGNRVAKTRW